MAKRKESARLSAADAIAELRAMPPKQFAKVRDALAKSLRNSGDAAAARAVKQLKKPAPSVWGANALAAQKADVVRDLLDAGAALRLAQRKTLSGAGSSAQMKDAMLELHAQVRRAVGEAAKLLSAAGESASATVTDRLRETLLAAAEGEDDVREALRTGTLAEDLSAAGFGMVAPLRGVEGSGKSVGAAEGRKREGEPRRARAAAARERAQTAAEASARREQEREAEREHQRALERAKKRLAIAEREHQRLEHAATVAEAKARAAREAAIAAKEKLDEARRAAV